MQRVRGLGKAIMIRIIFGTKHPILPRGSGQKVQCYMSEYHVTEPSGLTKSRDGDTYALLRQNIYFLILEKTLKEIQFLD